MSGRRGQFAALKSVIIFLSTRSQRVNLDFRPFAIFGNIRITKICVALVNRTIHFILCYYYWYPRDLLLLKCLVTNASIRIVVRQKKSFRNYDYTVFQRTKELKYG